MRKIKEVILATSALLWQLIFVQKKKALLLLHPFFWSFRFLYPLIKALISEGSTTQEFQFYTAAKSCRLRKGFWLESLMNICDILLILR